MARGSVRDKGRRGGSHARGDIRGSSDEGSAVFEMGSNHCGGFIGEAVAVDYPGELLGSCTQIVLYRPNLGQRSNKRFSTALYTNQRDENGKPRVTARVGFPKQVCVVSVPRVICLRARASLERGLLPSLQMSSSGRTQVNDPKLCRRCTLLPWS